ncbi:MAG TPA: glycine betaine ABC transporter substrate-binding protein, partial [Ramlibacter sp.]|nr:glycine betaine ABC transporter substrate-binding protein [Ramlibacter sp.]
MRRLLASAILLAAAWTAAHAAGDTLRVGSKRFTESYVLAQILAQKAAPHLPQPPEVRQGLGNTAIVYEALRSGSIDLYPEYAGTIALEILKSDKPMALDAMNRALAPLGLGAAIPLGFNDGYALALRGDDAARLGIRTLSDLARHPELKLGLSNEFIGRADGWPGLARRYGFAQRPTGLDHGLAYDAIAARQIDVMDIYTTDAKIGHLKLAVLQDDLNYFPRYDALVLYRLDVPQRFPKAWAALRTLEGGIDENAMIAMNARAELQGAAFDAIARDHLAGARANTQAARQGFMAKLLGPDLGRLTVQHLALVAASVLMASLVAIPLGLWVTARPRTRAALLAFAGLLQTVPSLALLAILIWAMGAIGVAPAIAALTLYALLPILRNTVTGLAEVPQGLKDAGSALGMTPAQRLRLVELPLAGPTIVAGVRIATAIAIGTATIA